MYTAANIVEEFYNQSQHSFKAELHLTSYFYVFTPQQFELLLLPYFLQQLPRSVDHFDVSVPPCSPCVQTIRFVTRKQPVRGGENWIFELVSLVRYEYSSADKTARPAVLMKWSELLIWDRGKWRLKRIHWLAKGLLQRAKIHASYLC